MNDAIIKLYVYNTCGCIQLSAYISYNDEDYKDKIVSVIEDFLWDYELIDINDMLNIEWNYDAGNSIKYIDIRERLCTELHEEAYPNIKNDLNEYIKKYLNSKSNVLILQGQPGTGKTNLIRKIIQKVRGKVIYINDESLMNSDILFTKLLNEDYAGIVIEDGDLLLTSRDRGNNNMHRFLNIADGVIKSLSKKIIFSTNLPNINSIDDALLRKGRCFDVLQFDKLD